jgi:hypothetical protein
MPLWVVEKRKGGHPINPPPDTDAVPSAYVTVIKVFSPAP